MMSFFCRRVYSLDCFVFQVKRSVCLPFTDYGPKNEDCVQQPSFLDSLQNYQQPPQYPPEKYQLPSLYSTPVIQSPTPQYFPSEIQHNKNDEDFFNPSSIDDLFVPSQNDINVAAFYT